MSTELRSRRILVTGGGGFLGGHLLEELARRGARSLVAPRSSEVDLTDASATLALFQRERPDLVFHLAARVGGIGANQRHPGSFFHANMAMGLNVLESARRVGVQKAIVVGTICSYPAHAPMPLREDSLWDGYPEPTNAPYGVAKRALLVMAQAYRQEYGCNFVVVLPVNLYGPRDNFDLETSHVIPAMIRKFLHARQAGLDEVVLWGDGSPTREFLYVTDAARGLALAAERYDRAEPINLGSGAEISIRELALKIAHKTAFGGRIVWDPTRPNGQVRRVLDVRRAREQLGFDASVGLDDGLDETLRWFAACEKGASVSARCEGL